MIQRTEGWTFWYGVSLSPPYCFGKLLNKYFCILNWLFSVFLGDKLGYKRSVYMQPPLIHHVIRWYTKSPMGLLTIYLYFIIYMYSHQKYVSTCISYLFMICARFSLLKFYVFIAFWTIVCVFNGNCLKSYRTVGDFFSDFWQRLKSQYKWEKKCSFVLEIKSATLFIITLVKIWVISPGEKE